MLETFLEKKLHRKVESEKASRDLQLPAIQDAVSALHRTLLDPQDINIIPKLETVIRLFRQADFDISDFFQKCFRSLILDLNCDYSAQGIEREYQSKSKLKQLICRFNSLSDQLGLHLDYQTVADALLKLASGNKYECSAFFNQSIRELKFIPKKSAQLSSHESEANQNIISDIASNLILVKALGRQIPELLFQEQNRINIVSSIVAIVANAYKIPVPTIVNKAQGKSKYSANARFDQNSWSIEFNFERESETQQTLLQDNIATALILTKSAFHAAIAGHCPLINKDNLTDIFKVDGMLVNLADEQQAIERASSVRTQTESSLSRWLSDDRVLFQRDIISAVRKSGLYQVKLPSLEEWISA